MTSFFLKITDFTDEYFIIWSRYCDLFFKFLELECPNIKVILNKGRQTDKFLNSEGAILTNSEFTNNKNIVNHFLDKFDFYIINNFEVEVLDWSCEKIFGDENHILGLSPVHYANEYYHSFINKLKLICHNNALKINNNQINNYEYEKNQFKHALNRINMETKIFLKNIKNKNSDDLNSLNFYKRGRIDVRNFGSKYNKLEIEIINIHIEWLPFNESSIYKKF